jgi:signal peptidase I
VPTHARSAVRLTLQILLLVAIGTAFFLRVPQVDGPSMLPRIQPGELVIINTLAYRFGPIARGDVVALRHDEPTAQTFLKRVVALPGERVALSDGALYVDGHRIAEPYVSFPDRRSVAPVIVPPGALYVLGDNRTQSEDSRSWGAVPERDVIGEAIVGLWPLRRLSP